MKALAKRNISAATVQEAARIAWDSLRKTNTPELLKTVDVQCMHNGRDNCLCTVHYKTAAQLRREAR